MQPAWSGSFFLLRSVPDPLARKDLERLIAVFLDTAQIRISKFELRQAQVDLFDFLQEVVEQQRVLELQRTIAVSRRPPQSLLIEVDHDRIGLVVTNYLTNALKHSSPDRPIEEVERVMNFRDDASFSQRACLMPALASGRGSSVQKRLAPLASGPFPPVRQYAERVVNGLGTGQLAHLPGNRERCHVWFQLPLLIGLAGVHRVLRQGASRIRDALSPLPEKWSIILMVRTTGAR